jgi:basic amino acid/polyamine antiporter, APA family
MSARPHSVPDPEVAAPADPRGSLPRKLGLWSAVAVLVGSTIGSGIFRSPAAIAERLPGPLPLIGVWVLAGFVTLCGALTLAEIASALPRTGGVYVFLREGWGRIAAFLFGWAQLTIIRAAALGAIATTFAEYFLRVLGFNTVVAPYDAWVHYTAAVAIGVMATMNILGVRFGAAIQNITTLAKYGALLFIILLAFSLGLPETGGNYTPLVPEGSFSVGALGLALVSVLWAYDGWADLSFVAGEVKDPRRTLPRALIGGTLAVIGIYLLANLAYLAVLDVSEIRQSPLVAADVAERVLGAGGLVFVSATVMISTLGTLNGSTLTSPRIFFAMADDRMLFRKVAEVHPRFQTPYIAIALTALLGITFSLARDFEQLADTFVIAVVPFYLMAVAAVFRLRGTPGYDPSFRVPLYPIIPAIFILATLFLLGNSVVDASSRWGTLAVFGAILVGVPVYYLTVARRRQP